MNILYFILTLAVFQPLTAHAEAVFDDSGSFQIARSVKLGREKASMNPVKGNDVNSIQMEGTFQKGQSTGLSERGSTLPGLSLTGISTYQGISYDKKSGDANINGKTGTQQCPTGKYVTAGGCADCPDHGHCTGMADWMCQSGYWQNTSIKSCVDCSSQAYIKPNSWDSKKCDGTTKYTCLTSAWEDSRNADPEKCSQCPTNATCNGKTYTCNGSGWQKWNATPNSKPNTYHVASAKTPDQCPQCPTDWECNGSATKYCYGRKTAGSSWSSSYSYVRSGSNDSPTECKACGSTWECNGTTTRYCKGYKGGSWTTSNAYVSAGSNTSPTNCTACPSNWECNGTTTKYCYGKNTAGSTWQSKYAYVSAGTNASPTTCNACPTNGVCNGTTTFRCTDSSGNNNTSWTKTNGYHASASTCARCTSDGVFECDGIDKYCYGKNTVSGWNYATNGHAIATNAGATECAACPTNATCRGTTEWRCNDSYYRTSSSYSKNSTMCLSVDSGTVCKTASGYDRFNKVSENNGNTRYCIQPVPANPVSTSYSTVGEECPSGYVWRYHRTGNKGGSLSGIWAAGCYPKGNCNSGEACMPMGYNDGNPGWQCTSQTGGTGRSCNPNG